MEVIICLLSKLHSQRFFSFSLPATQNWKSMVFSSTYLFAIGQHLNRHDCHGESARICIQALPGITVSTTCGCRMFFLALTICMKVKADPAWPLPIRVKRHLPLPYPITCCRVRIHSIQFIVRPSFPLHLALLYPGSYVALVPLCLYF